VFSCETYSTQFIMLLRFGSLASFVCFHFGFEFFYCTVNTFGCYANLNPVKKEFVS
jgi:hypothetical protein